MSDELQLSAPWMTYYRKVYSIFDEDPEVAVAIGDEDGNKVITILVENGVKADAISQIMPSEVQFGNVSVKVNVIPSNDEPTKESLFRNAFAGNPIVSDIASIEGVFSNPICYVVFEPSIVQFWNDDLGDINGMYTALPQDIAKEVFSEQDGVLFCTDLISETDVVEY